MSKKVLVIICAVVMTLCAILTVGTGLFYKSYKKDLADLKKVFLEEEDKKVEIKARQLEMAFRQIFQGARTIALLPSIRSLEGGNLPKGFPSKYDTARFSTDAQLTVQQIYNNLASNINVSEVYCVLKGFRPDRGETPFFMYDELIVQSGKQESHGHEEQHDTDFPEEYEDAEYDFYMELLGRIEKEHPEFERRFGEDLDSMPFYGSPAVRTCDNSQYSSKTRGNVKNALGMMFSVPVYSNKDKGKLLGIISVIIRTNVFEAMLMDQPFVVVTAEDRVEMKRQKWEEKKKPADFVLSNAKRGVSIFDRRNSSLDTRIKERKAGAMSDFVLERGLETSDDTEWLLTYLADTGEYSIQAGAQKRFFLARLITFYMLVLLIVGAMCGFIIQRYNTVGKIKTAIEQLSMSSAQMASATDQVAHTSQKLARNTAEQNDSLDKISGELDRISNITRQNSESILNSEKISLETTKAVSQGLSVSTEMIDAIQKIQSSSQETAKIIKTIDEIAFQTNILSLNASVEAARAGEAGKSFAVVAQEVRNLAQRSAEAARNTGLLLDQARVSSEAGVKVSQQVSEHLKTIASGVERFNTIISEVSRAGEVQSSGIENINKSMGQMNKATRNNAAFAESSAAAGEELAAQAQDLNCVIQELALALNKNAKQQYLQEHSTALTRYQSRDE